MPAQTAPTTYQGDPPGMKFSPRVGLVYSLNPKTVVRAGYGIYWAPWNYQGVRHQLRQVGYSQSTLIQQSRSGRPSASTTRSRTACIQPVGNSLGALTGVGGQIEFIDQGKKAPQVHQYSVDINRELPGNIAVGFEYVGATGRDLGLGGTQRRHHQHQPGGSAVPRRSARR